MQGSQPFRALMAVSKAAHIGVAYWACGWSQIGIRRVTSTSPPAPSFSFTCISTTPAASTT